jgi:hypothetical protein
MGRNQRREPNAPKPAFKVEDPEWYKKADCFGGNSNIFVVEVEQSKSAAKNELRARNLCVACPVRHDCVIDAHNKNDVYSIRGGVRFVPGRPTNPCMLCGLPAAREGRLCLHCVSRRYCVDCDQPYVAENIDDEPGLCQTCNPETQTTRIKKARGTA